MGAMLSIQGLVVNYGSTRAIRGTSFRVNQGEIVTLIDASGAGKTTTLHAISGPVKTKSGSVSFCDHDPLSAEPHKILEFGVAHAPESRRVLSRMTVMEDLQMDACIRNDASGISEDYNMMFERLLRLKEHRRQAAGMFSSDEQRMLTIDRALMDRPKMLLLDKPSMGPSPFLVGEIFKIISDVNKSGVTALLVGQNAKKVLEIADRACVLETGGIVMSGDTLELADNGEVREIYLGD